MAGSRDDNFFFSLGFSPSGTQFYEAIVGGRAQATISGQPKKIPAYFQGKISALEFHKCIDNNKNVREIDFIILGQTFNCNAKYINLMINIFPYSL